MNRNQYELYHYGVKGMKWGVRRAEKRDAKNQARREKYLVKTEQKAKRSRKLAREANAGLKDLKKNGQNAQLVADRAKSNAIYKSEMAFTDSDARRGTRTDASTRRLVGEFAYNVFENDYKKEAYKELSSEYIAKSKYYSQKAKQWSAANEAVMNMPIDASNREYRKAIRRAKKAMSI